MAIQAAFMVPHPPMIIPAIGRGAEKSIQETIDSYNKVAGEIAQLKPETIIFSSPHSILYTDYFHISPGIGAKGDFSGFGAGEVKFDEQYDVELRDEICRLAKEDDFPAGTLGERETQLDHGTMVPLWFIRKKYRQGKILRIGLSGLGLIDHYRLGEIIQKAVNDVGRKVVFVASGDLSHKLQHDGPYGFAPEGPIYDKRIMDVAREADFEKLFDFEDSFCKKASECGHRSFVIMSGALDGLKVEGKVYSHQDITGVGYGIASFYPDGEDESRHCRESYIEKMKNIMNSNDDSSDEYVQLAKATIETYLLDHAVVDIPCDLPKEMLTKQAGAFVSIHKNGHLRGCIGTILPTTGSIASEIIQNAISASTRDPRFNPISPEELPFLDVSVDILGEPEEIYSCDDLDVKRYGVIVSSGNRRGLLLPDLDGVDTVEEQISIARQKGGISPSEDIKLQRFEVVRHF